MIDKGFRDKLKELKLRLDVNRAHPLGETGHIFSVLGVGNTPDDEMHVGKPELRRILDLAIGNLAAQEYIEGQHDGREKLPGNKEWFAALSAVGRALGRRDPKNEAPYCFLPVAEMYLLCEFREREARSAKAEAKATDERAAALHGRLRRIIEISAKGKTAAMNEISKIAMGASDGD